MGKDNNRVIETKVELNANLTWVSNDDKLKAMFNTLDKLMMKSSKDSMKYYTRIEDDAESVGRIIQNTSEKLYESYNGFSMAESFEEQKKYAQDFLNYFNNIKERISWTDESGKDIGAPKWLESHGFENFEKILREMKVFYNNNSDQMKVFDESYFKALGDFDIELTKQGADFEEFIQKLNSNAEEYLNIIEKMRQKVFESLSQKDMSRLNIFGLEDLTDDKFDDFLKEYKDRANALEDVSNVIQNILKKISNGEQLTEDDFDFKIAYNYLDDDNGSFEDIGRFLEDKIIEINKGKEDLRKAEKRIEELQRQIAEGVVGDEEYNRIKEELDRTKADYHRLEQQYEVQTEDLNHYYDKYYNALREQEERIEEEKNKIFRKSAEVFEQTAVGLGAGIDRRSYEDDWDGEYYKAIFDNDGIQRLYEDVLDGTTDVATAINKMKTMYRDALGEMMDIGSGESNVDIDVLQGFDQQLTDVAKNSKKSLDDISSVKSKVEELREAILELKTIIDEGVNVKGITESAMQPLQDAGANNQNLKETINTVEVVEQIMQAIIGLVDDKSNVSIDNVTALLDKISSVIGVMKRLAGETESNRMMNAKDLINSIRSFGEIGKIDTPSIDQIQNFFEKLIELSKVKNEVDAIEGTVEKIDMSWLQQFKDVDFSQFANLGKLKKESTNEFFSFIEKLQEIANDKRVDIEKLSQVINFLNFSNIQMPQNISGAVLTTISKFLKELAELPSVNVSGILRLLQELDISKFQSQTHDASRLDLSKLIDYIKKLQDISKKDTDINKLADTLRSLGEFLGADMSNFDIEKFNISQDATKNLESFIRKINNINLDKLKELKDLNFSNILGLNSFTEDTSLSQGAIVNYARLFSDTIGKLTPKQIKPDQIIDMASFDSSIDKIINEIKKLVSAFEELNGIKITNPIIGADGKINGFNIDKIDDKNGILIDKIDEFVNIFKKPQSNSNKLDNDIKDIGSLKRMSPENLLKEPESKNKFHAMEYQMLKLGNQYLSLNKDGDYYKEYARLRDIYRPVGNELKEESEEVENYIETISNSLKELSSAFKMEDVGISFAEKLKQEFEEVVDEIKKIVTAIEELNGIKISEDFDDIGKTFNVEKIEEFGKGIFFDDLDAKLKDVFSNSEGYIDRLIEKFNELINMFKIMQSTSNEITIYDNEYVLNWAKNNDALYDDYDKKDKFIKRTKKQLYDAYDSMIERDFIRKTRNGLNNSSFEEFKDSFLDGRKFEEEGTLEDLKNYYGNRNDKFIKNILTTINNMEESIKNAEIKKEEIFDKMFESFYSSEKQTKINAFEDIRDKLIDIKNAIPDGSIWNDFLNSDKIEGFSTSLENLLKIVDRIRESFDLMTGGQYYDVLKSWASSDSIMRETRGRDDSTPDMYVYDKRRDEYKKANKYKDSAHGELERWVLANSLTGKVSNSHIVEQPDHVSNETINLLYKKIKEKYGIDLIGDMFDTATHSHPIEKGSIGSDLTFSDGDIGWFWASFEEGIKKLQVESNGRVNSFDVSSLGKYADNFLRNIYFDYEKGLDNAISRDYKVFDEKTGKKVTDYSLRAKDANKFLSEIIAKNIKKINDKNGTSFSTDPSDYLKQFDVEDFKMDSNGFRQTSDDLENLISNLRQLVELLKNVDFSDFKINGLEEIPKQVDRIVNGFKLLDDELEEINENTLSLGKLDKFFDFGKDDWNITKISDFMQLLNELFVMIKDISNYSEVPELSYDELLKWADDNNNSNMVDKVDNIKERIKSKKELIERLKKANEDMGEFNIDEAVKEYNRQKRIDKQNQTNFMEGVSKDQFIDEQWKVFHKIKEDNINKIYKLEREIEDLNGSYDSEMYNIYSAFEEDFNSQKPINVILDNLNNISQAVESFTKLLPKDESTTLSSLFGDINIGNINEVTEAIRELIEVIAKLNNIEIKPIFDDAGKRIGIDVIRKGDERIEEYKNRINDINKKYQSESAPFLDDSVNLIGDFDGEFAFLDAIPAEVLKRSEKIIENIRTGAISIEEAIALYEQSLREFYDLDLNPDILIKNIERFYGSFGDGLKNEIKDLFSKDSNSLNIAEDIFNKMLGSDKFKEDKLLAEQKNQVLDYFRSIANNPNGGIAYDSRIQKELKGNYAKFARKIGGFKPEGSVTFMEIVEEMNEVLGTTFDLSSVQNAVESVLKVIDAKPMVDKDTIVSKIQEAMLRTREQMSADKNELTLADTLDKITDAKNRMEGADDVIIRTSEQVVTSLVMQGEEAEYAADQFERLVQAKKDAGVDTIAEAKKQFKEEQKKKEKKEAEKAKEEEKQRIEEANKKRDIFEGLDYTVDLEANEKKIDNMGVILTKAKEAKEEMENAGRKLTEEEQKDVMFIDALAEAMRKGRVNARDYGEITKVTDRTYLNQTKSKNGEITGYNTDRYRTIFTPNGSYQFKYIEQEADEENGIDAKKGWFIQNTQDDIINIENYVKKTQEAIRAEKELADLQKSLATGKISKDSYNEESSAVNARLDRINNYRELLRADIESMENIYKLVEGTLKESDDLYNARKKRYANEVEQVKKQQSDKDAKKAETDANKKKSKYDKNLSEYRKASDEIVRLEKEIKENESKLAFDGISKEMSDEEISNIRTKISSIKALIEIRKEERREALRELKKNKDIYNPSDALDIIKENNIQKNKNTAEVERKFDEDYRKYNEKQVIDNQKNNQLYERTAKQLADTYDKVYENYTKLQTATIEGKSGSDIVKMQNDIDKLLDKIIELRETMDSLNESGSISDDKIKDIESMIKTRMESAKRLSDEAIKDTRDNLAKKQAEANKKVVDQQRKDDSNEYTKQKNALIKQYEEYANAISKLKSAEISGDKTDAEITKMKDAVDDLKKAIDATIESMQKLEKGGNIDKDTIASAKKEVMDAKAKAGRDASQNINIAKDKKIKTDKRESDSAEKQLTGRLNAVAKQVKEVESLRDSYDNAISLGLDGKRELNLLAQAEEKLRKLIDRLKEFAKESKYIDETDALGKLVETQKNARDEYAYDKQKKDAKKQQDEKARVAKENTKNATSSFDKQIKEIREQSKKIETLRDMYNNSILVGGNGEFEGNLLNNANKQLDEMIQKLQKFAKESKDVLGFSNNEINKRINNAVISGQNDYTKQQEINAKQANKPYYQQALNNMKKYQEEYAKLAIELETETNENRRTDIIYRMGLLEEKVANAREQAERFGSTLKSVEDVANDINNIFAKIDESVSKVTTESDKIEKKRQKQLEKLSENGEAKDANGMFSINGVKGKTVSQKDTKDIISKYLSSLGYSSDISKFKVTGLNDAGIINSRDGFATFTGEVRNAIGELVKFTIKYDELNDKMSVSTITEGLGLKLDFKDTLEGSADEVSEAIKKAGDLSKRLNDFSKKYKDMFSGDDFANKSFSDDMKEMTEDFEKLADGGKIEDFDTRVKNLTKKLNTYQNKYKILAKQILGESLESGQFKELKDVQKYLSQYAKENNLGGINGDVKVNRLSNGIIQVIGYAKDFNSEVTKITANWSDLTGRMSISTVDMGQQLSGLAGWFSNFGKRMYTLSQYWFSMYFSPMDLMRYARTIISSVTELDTAMIDLQKTAKMSGAELNQVYENSAEKASKFGITTQEYIQATADMSRAGFSTYKEAITMADATALFTAISPDVEASESATGLVSILRAFDIEAENIKDEVLSKINVIGNNFSTTNGEVLAGLEKSASSMSAANNSLDETIALFTASYIGSKLWQHNLKYIFNCVDCLKSYTTT